MTDEEFYKNKLIALCNNMLIVDKGNIRHYLGDDIEPIIKIKDNGDKELVDLKCKLIIKEKTWYKSRANKDIFIAGRLPELLHLDECILGVDTDGFLMRYRVNGFRDENIISCDDLIRECTPEEVKEIEDKLREKNNDR